MRVTTSIFATLLLLGGAATGLAAQATAPAASASQSTTPTPPTTQPGEVAITKLPQVERWTAALGSPTEHATAWSALRAMAAGPQDSEETREALFALSHHVTASGTAPDRIGLDLLSTAVTLYPDDPRTPGVLRALSRIHLEAGDTFGAHVAFGYLARHWQPATESGLIARAAANAATVRDMGAALTWAQQVKPATLTDSDRPTWLLARLKAGQAMGRLDLALESARELALAWPDRLNIDAQALLASTRTHESLGLLDHAVNDAELFVNIHPRAPERPELMLLLGRLYTRSGKTSRAASALNWLIEAHPGSMSAVLARLDLLELDAAPADAGQAADYLDVLRNTADTLQGRAVCVRFADRFIAAGWPLELVAALARLAEEQNESVGPLAARQCLNDRAEQAIRLLASRHDAVGVAAVAEQLATLALRVPPASATDVAAARRTLGLRAEAPATLHEALGQARRAARSGDWVQLIETLESPARFVRDADVELRAEARRLLAEGLWRLERNAEALARLDEALALGVTGRSLRSLRVLRADIQFASGQREQACADYDAAAALGSSRWVNQQLTRCATAALKSGAGA